MADNATGVGAASTSYTFATDEIGGAHYQRVKLTWGVDGSVADASAVNPIPVVQTGTHNVTVNAALPAGTNNIGDVDVLSLPALPAGTNNIGDVDVLTLPSLPAGTNNIGDVDVLTVPTFGTTTREYALANAVRVAFTSTSTAEAVLPTLGTTRELRLAASQRCWLKWGATGLSAAAAEAASFPIEANSPEVVRIPSGATHYRVIRDSADGNLTMTPVA